MTAECILVVDDEPDIRRLVQEILEDEQYQVVTAKNAVAARAAYADRHPDLVLLDIWMPDTDGISLLKEWSQTGKPHVPVVMMSGHGTVDTAVEATRFGACDFIEKPLSIGKLLVTVERALESARHTDESGYPQRQIQPVSTLIGHSAIMQRLREDVERVAKTDSWVLITGEPGSGKAVTSRYLHAQSERANQPFVEIGLSVVPAKDVAAVLFGREHDGVITAGSFEQATGGTLVLYEIGELDVVTQSQLVRALAERSFVRVGGTSSFNMNVRVIASSSQDLEKKVADGSFREDLYYRLNVLPIHMPPLRDHREDVPELINFYRDWMVEQEQLPFRKFSTPAINQLRNYSWPGNVRELRNMVQQLLVLNRGVEIDESEVERALSNRGVSNEEIAESVFDLPLRAARDQFEKAYLEYHLKRTHGNVSELAALADMERTHLYRKLKSLGIDPKSSRSK
ncbi:MAG: sigma-54 dependent transcriptional regulator [Gammaproteobacteria bacterium]|jgi:DNA-binding NtrC family response regulator|nr:sigma-54 dependent transcriptional regulator [Gammaproteobacteria bacterium]